MKKVIGLMVSYNEIHFLPYSIPCLQRICDEIIVLDKSNDGSKEWLNKQNKVIVYNEEDIFDTLTYKDRRQFLLDVGRKHNGTHFVTIDADEVISNQLSEQIKVFMRKLHTVKGLACNWCHMQDLTNVLVDFDTNAQGIAFYDDGTNYTGRNLVHEDKLPHGFPQLHQNSQFKFFDGALFHFGAVNKKFVDTKWIYYMICEFEDGFSPEFINLKYCRSNHLSRTVKLGKYTYPNPVDEKILNADYKPTFEHKICDYILNNTSKLKDLYKLNIWSRDIIKFCEDNIKTFDKKKLSYIRGETDNYLTILLIQFKCLLLSGNYLRILKHIYKCINYIIYR